MNSIKNLAIKKKLLLLISLPLLGLLFFSITQNISIYKEIKEADKIEIGIHFTRAISQLLHETQRERGFTAGFIGSEGNNFKKQLISQRKITDLKIKSLLNEKIKMKDFFPSEYLRKNAETLLKNIEKLNTIRKRVDSLNIKVSDAIKYYTDINSLLAEDVVLISKLTNNAQLSQQITAFSNFLLSKERAGIERAIGANTLSRDSFAKGMREKLSKLISEQDSYMNSFKYYASKNSIKYYENTVKGKEVDEVNRIREVLQGAIHKQKIIASIGEYIGYGGIIHNFKNYLIRGDNTYKENVNAQYVEFIKLLDEYKQIPNLKEEELRLLAIVEETFSKYHSNLKIIEQGLSSNLDIKQLDREIKVNDRPAMVALYRLSMNLFGDDANYWFSQITKKINLLKKVDDHLSNELIKDVRQLESSLTSTFISTLVLLPSPSLLFPPLLSSPSLPSVGQSVSPSI